VLLGRDAISWKVTLSPRTRLVKVKLGGWKAQSVAGLPDKAELEMLVHDPVHSEKVLAGVHSEKDPHYQKMIRDVCKSANQERLASACIKDSPKGLPIVVDRVVDDQRLWANYPRPVPAKDVPELKFSAFQHQPNDEGESKYSFGAFTLQSAVFEKHEAFKGDALAKMRENEKRQEAMLGPLPPSLRGACYARIDAEDRIYAVSHPIYGSGESELACLDVFNARGALFKRLLIRGPLDADCLTTSCPPQLLHVDGRLVLIVNPRDEDDRCRETFIYLLDPKSGQATLTGRYLSPRR
jgi:hypothetical protein